MWASDYREHESWASSELSLSHPGDSRGAASPTWRLVSWKTELAHTCILRVPWAHSGDRRRVCLSQAHHLITGEPLLHSSLGNFHFWLDYSLFCLAVVSAGACWLYSFPAIHTHFSNVSVELYTLL